MNTKHTPGKWVAEEVGVSDAGPNGVPVYEVIADNRVRVCECVGEADARLIAAAPELLASLKEMLIQYGVRGGNGPSARAREAIAKATGM